ncbi:glutaminase A [Kocuria sp. NPDC057446]|uniref:glutaminase A n=1 Tax=Kocuria sp. NPDC057446 TaxID=3346137 RepID=UPI0036831DAC
MPHPSTEEEARAETGLFGPSAVTEYLEQVVEQLRDVRGGEPSSSIPALAGADTERFGIVIATADGHVYEAGSTRDEFSIQSISKAFTYALALSDLGAEAVHAKMDVEPSGDAYNEISLQPGTGRPANPMINAGAIASTWLVPDSDRDLRRDRIRDAYSRCAGRDLAISPEVLAQEHDAGDRNRALGYLLASAGIIEGDPAQALEDYFAQCSVLITCRDLALMGATLANAGTNPLTGDEVFDVDTVSRVLSVMSSCGMYDDAGEWMVRVGLPAKSGVGGGIIAVLPGELAVAVFSPALDRHGNSVRGVLACERLSQDLDLHFTHTARVAHSTVRASYPIDQSPSLVRRNAEAEAVLAEHGRDGVVVELQGDLLFTGTETAIRTVRDVAYDASYVVVDMRRVDAIADYAMPLLAKTRAELHAAGRTVVAVASDPGFAGPFKGEPPLEVFPSRAAAIKWVEDRLLEEHGGPECTPSRVKPVESELLSRLDPEDARTLRARTVERTWAAGENILRTGQNFAGIHLIVSGSVSMSLRTPTGERVELQVLGPGMSFGELALGTGDRQHVTLSAVTDVTARVLPPQALAELEQEEPALGLRLWKALARDGFERADQQWRDAAVHASSSDW